ncbi:uncharacterized protein LAESUDRAFT_816165 [Laetiporus sulphureus 93-53]|uniref:Uncharacterized protein n=1 Tax=Laetiporus sulphureus 93-53 TaxID=1314785 RepID=A0A165BG18_9APHY|nr:uncharacterized protein LAESUDRAFT_816165 [Laetiporus sulphureus 93-53]KZT00981.1 hypothetical protein LAESUDRAFT_816165 [Laetiporus sulphureus 93-53]
MAASYSSLFASGLFAPLPQDNASPIDPTVPRQLLTSLHSSSSSSLTTIGANSISVPANVTADLPLHHASNASVRPSMRRRRSSVATSITAFSSMNIKNSRGGPSMGNQLGRTRSGSISGHVARLRRVPRRAAPPLLAPPPNAPLPELPIPSPIKPSGSDTPSASSASAPEQTHSTTPLPLLGITTTNYTNVEVPAMPKRPSPRRTYTLDTLPPLPSPSLLDPSSSFLSISPAQSPTSAAFASGVGYAFPSMLDPAAFEPARVDMESGMDVDCPKPSDGERMD